MADPNDDEWDDDDADAEYREAADECAAAGGGFCYLAGTEHCDFVCPFRDDLC